MRLYKKLGAGGGITPPDTSMQFLIKCFHTLSFFHFTYPTAPQWKQGLNSITEQEWNESVEGKEEKKANFYENPIMSAELCKVLVQKVFHLCFTAVAQSR